MIKGMRGISNRLPIENPMAVALTGQVRNRCSMALLAMTVICQSQSSRYPALACGCAALFLRCVAAIQKHPCEHRRRMRAMWQLLFEQAMCIFGASGARQIPVRYLQLHAQAFFQLQFISTARTRHRALCLSQLQSGAHQSNTRAQKSLLSISIFRARTSRQVQGGVCSRGCAHGQAG